MTTTVQFMHNIYKYPFEQILRDFTDLAPDIFEKSKFLTKTTTQDDDNPNLLNTKINLQAIDFVYFAQYWEEHYNSDVYTNIYLVARQKCNDEDNKHFYLSLSCVIEYRAEGKIVLSEKLTSFLKQLKLHDCKIEEICRYMEKNQNVKIENIERRKNVFWCKYCEKAALANRESTIAEIHLH